jgi:hypothetical protein
MDDRRGSHPLVQPPTVNGSLSYFSFLSGQAAYGPFRFWVFALKDDLGRQAESPVSTQKTQNRTLPANRCADVFKNPNLPFRHNRIVIVYNSISQTDSAFRR